MEKLKLKKKMKKINEIFENKSKTDVSQEEYQKSEKLPIDEEKRECHIIAECSDNTIHEA